MAYVSSTHGRICEADLCIEIGTYALVSTNARKMIYITHHPSRLGHHYHE